MNTAESIYRSLLPVLDSYRQRGCTSAQIQLAQAGLQDFLFHNMVGTVSIDDERTIRLHMAGDYGHMGVDKIIVFSIPMNGPMSMTVNGEETLKYI